MSSKFLLAFFVSFLYLHLSAQSRETRIDNSKRILSTVNKSIEVLEMRLRSSDSKNACLVASRAAKIIKENISPLKNIEPNYDWIEIREVLLDVKKKHC